MFDLHKFFALIHSKGPGTGGTDKQTICLIVSYASVRSRSWAVVFELHVWHHGCGSVDPSECAEATGSVLIGDWRSFLQWAASSKRLEGRGLARQRVETHAQAQHKPDRC